jgi:hypothetical protein
MNNKGEERTTANAETNYSEEVIDFEVLKRLMEYSKKPKAVCIKALRDNRMEEISTIMALVDEDD